jgi:hypothetical protein
MREHAPFLLRLILATASANDVRLLLLLLQQGQWILRMLEIRRLPLLREAWPGSSASS